MFLRYPPLILILFAICASAIAQSPSTPPAAGGISLVREPKSVFPEAYLTDYQRSTAERNSRLLYGATPEAEVNTSAPIESLLLNNDILAYYGHPNSRNMGILGRYSKEELNQRLTTLAAEYRAAGGRNVIKAFYIIFGTVWPAGEIGIIGEALLTEYIEFALKNDMLVFIDHQIGRYTPAEALRRMLPWLRYPNVHLALDPEWRTTKPMVEIGTVTAEEINEVQRIMENYMIANNIPGERLLVIHQFNWRMISNRERIQANFSKVRLVHCADGFGTPQEKRESYAFNARAANMPVKAFKLFYNFEIPGAGFDRPLLTPREVFALEPRPYLVMYQ
jgi:hypothetical protein